MQRKNQKGQKGAALVEFALILPVLMLIVMGIIEFGIIMFDKAIITNASREAARTRVNFNVLTVDEGAIKTRIITSYGNLPISFGSDTLTADDITFTRVVEATGAYWTARVNYRYDFMYLPISSLNLASTTIMRQEQ